MSRHSSGTRAPSTDGRLFFAATTMLVTGVFQVLLGIAVILRDQFFVATANYLYVVNVYAWGWAHLILGGLLVLTGLALYTGAFFARVVGVTLAALSAVANFLFIPYYPVWSLLIIGLDVALIWALTTSPTRRMEPMPGMAPATGAAMSNPERWTATNQSLAPGRVPGTSGMGTAPAPGTSGPARSSGGPGGQGTTDPPATA